MSKSPDNSELFDFVTSEVRHLTNGMITGTIGDTINYVNILSALIDATEAYNHPFIKSKSHHILSFPQSYAAPGFWDIVLRFEIAAMCGLDEIPYKEPSVSKFFDDLKILEKTDFATKSGPHFLPTDILFKAIEKLGRKKLLSFDASPRVVYFYTHYVWMLKVRCRSTLPVTEQTLESLVEMCTHHAYTTMFDVSCGHIHPHEAYERLGMALFVLSSAQQGDSCANIINLLYELIQKAHPTYDQICFLLQDIQQTIPILTSGSKSESHAEELSQSLSDIVIKKIYQGNADIFVDLRKRAVQLKSVVSLLDSGSRKKLAQLLDGAVLTDAIIQIRQEIISTLVAPTSRKWLRNFLSDNGGETPLEKIENLHQWLKENVKCKTEIIDMVQSPQETIDNREGDCDCVCCVIASCLMLLEQRGNLCLLLPELAMSGPGHMYAEFVLFQNEKHCRVPIDPNEEFGKISPNIIAQENRIITVPLDMLVTDSVDKLCEYIQVEREAINTRLNQE